MSRLLPVILACLCLLPAQAAPFLRARPLGPEASALDIAARAYTPAANTNLTLWLVGVAHIGSSNYYAEIQTLLDSVDLVLFEGVDGHREEFRTMTRENSSTSSVLQVQLADALGLEFQLHAIDYTRDHFRNCDVSAVDLYALLSGDDPDGLTAQARAELEELMATMETESMGGAFLARALDTVRESPALRKGLRYMLVEIMGNLRGDLQDYGGIPPKMRRLLDVLIEARNNVVLRDVDAVFQDPGPVRSIAVFYGAAHMDDLERRLSERFELQPTAHRWFTAFTADLRRSHLTLPQRKLILWFVQEQVRELRRLAPRTP